MLYYTILYYTILYDTILYSTLLYYTVGVLYASLGRILHYEAAILTLTLPNPNPNPNAGAGGGRRTLETDISSAFNLTAQSHPCNRFGGEDDVLLSHKMA